MRALAIDTSTDCAGVALCDSTSCIARTPFANEASESGAAPSAVVPGQHAERILGLIDGLLQQSGWKKADLELVACCIGPGSFTGVRVGVATAKGIALALGIPIVGIGALEAMASAHLTRAALDADHAVVALLDARKSEVFWAAYAHDGALLAGPGHVAATGIGDLVRLVPRPKITFLGEIAPRIGLEPADVASSAATDRPDPAEIGRMAQKRLAERGPDDLDALEPAYVRPPDITLPRASS